MRAGFAGTAKVAAVCLLLAVAMQAQAPASPEAAQPGETVSFTWDPPTAPGATGHHYEVTVGSDGEASYLSTGPLLPDSTPGDDFTHKFTVSAATREQIFTLARQADYFHGDFDYTKHRIANTGPKTLVYKGADAEGKTTYNWSENATIQQLTHLFQSLVNTQESGRRMLYYRRFDKLGLEPELSQLEDLAKSGDAIELQGIAPLLQQISSDYSVMHVARARADRLLKVAAGAPAGQPPASQ